jgi:hypothetical protein
MHAVTAFRRPSWLVLAVLATGCANASPTPEPRAFFAGKTLTYIVATEAGGGYDTYGRLVSQYLGRHLGVARVVVRNLPGGGHIVGTNELYRARPDGLTLGTFNSGVIYAQLLERRGLHARLDRMSWVGKASGEPRLLVTSRQSGFRSVDEARRAGRPLLMGAGGIGTEGYIELRKYIDVAGREGTDHLFLSNRAGTRHIDAGSEKLTYFEAFLADVRDRTSTAMPEGHALTVTRLAIEAQAAARTLASRG